MASRRARWTGVAVGFVNGALFLLATGFTQFTNSGTLVHVSVAPGFILFLGALLVAGIDRSFRSGIQTAVGRNGRLIAHLLHLVIGVHAVDSVGCRAAAGQ